VGAALVVVVGAALVVVVGAALVVVVGAALVVVVGAALVVVVVVDAEGRVSLPNKMVPAARWPLMSPMATTHVSPAACCAAVGGHGYAAASVVSFPEVVQLGMVEVVVGLAVELSVQVGV
jgi:intracellular sulfur oxidation DsrE/DsrF family protein